MAEDKNFWQRLGKGTENLGLHALTMGIGSGIQNAIYGYNSKEGGSWGKAVEGFAAGLIPGVSQLYAANMYDKEYEELTEEEKVEVDYQAQMQAYADQLGLFTKESDSGYIEYLNNLNQATAQQEAAQLSAIDRAEQDAYRAAGQAQNSMYNDIKQRRMQALRSGQSSAQVSATEMQNLLAAQTGATALARQTMQDKMQVYGNFAGAYNQNAAAAQQQASTNANTLLGGYAQMYAADKMLEETRYSIDNMK